MLFDYRLARATNMSWQEIQDLPEDIYELFAWFASGEARARRDKEQKRGG